MLTRDDLLARATALLPALRARAQATEDARQLLPETLRDYADAGLLRVANPQRYGGYGLEPDVMFDIGMELSRACGSSGWTYTVLLIHNWMLGHWPEQMQDEYFATGPDTVCSSSFGPRAHLEPVDGGYKLTGRWDFSSGADVGTWVLLGAMRDTDYVFAMLPRSDYEIVDTWHVSGLRGTGSKDIAVDGAFVPPHRLVRTADMAAGKTDGWSLHKRASYRLPFWTLINHTIVTPVVGMAQGMVDEYTSALLASKSARNADSVAAQLRLAESSAEVDAARLIVRSNVAELLRRADRDDTDLTQLEKARYRRDNAYATRLCVNATARLFEGSGGAGIYASSAAQRFFRDVNAASHHSSLYWDPAMENYARLALGREPLDPR